ncbi:hypothetical protein ES703_36537 [subsurface metagenome]
MQRNPRKGRLRDPSKLRARENQVLIMDFEEFLNLCRDADKLLDSLKHEPRLQGRAPRNLKPAAIHYLAQKRGQNVTQNHLYIIYGIRQPRLIEIKKLLKRLNNK